MTQKQKAARNAAKLKQIRRYVWSHWPHRYAYHAPYPFAEFLRILNKRKFS